MPFLATVMRGFRASTQQTNMDRAAQVLAQYSYGGGTGAIELVNGVTRSYAAMYVGQPWIYAAVNKLARGISRLPLKAYVEAGENGERQRVRTGPLAELLRSPWPGARKGELAESIVGNMAIYGNSVVVPMRDRVGQPPQELRTSSMAHWSVSYERDGITPAWYVFRSETGVVVPFRPDEVIHFRWWGPGPTALAPSPMEPLRRTLLVEDAAQRTQISSYENGARPVGAFVVPQILKPETAAALRDRLNATYGGVDNAYKIALLDGGAKWEPMSHNLVDSDVINTRKLTREEVAAVYDVPPPVLGILDRATFSNITEQHWMLYQDTFDPWLTLIEETLQAQLVDREFGEDAYVEFDLHKVLRGNPIQEMTSLTGTVGAGIMTIDEARARLNLPPLNLPATSTALIPTNNQSPAARSTRKRVERNELGEITGVVEEQL